MTASTMLDRPLSERAQEVLRRSGNPFRNYFARNPDDEVCARYHVPELFAAERELLLNVVDLYRYDPMTHSEVVPVLGNKGAGKTHLLHSIKHGPDGGWQLLVAPGVYQRDTNFLEYLLFQIIDTLLGGGRQKGQRPLEFVGEQLVRRQLSFALRDLSPEERIELFPPPGLGRWARRLGLGQSQAHERADWLMDQLNGYGNYGRNALPLNQILTEAGLSVDQVFHLLNAYIERTEPHNTAGLMRRSIYQGFARAVLLRDELTLASFLTYGFAILEFHVRPTRQDLVLALFKVLMELFRSLKTPVVVAFDQLEDLLLARRSDDAHRIAEAFFAGIVQVMHQIDGVCFLIFAERGLWNRFVPSLDSYIQDRLNNPVHVPKQGTIKALRLEAPSPELVRRVVEARLKPALEELPDAAELSDIYPFNDEAVIRIARTEPTLRDMLQQFRHLFDHLIYDSEERGAMTSREVSSEPTIAGTWSETPEKTTKRAAEAELAAAKTDSVIPPLPPLPTPRWEEDSLPVATANASDPQFPTSAKQSGAAPSEVPNPAAAIGSVHLVESMEEPRQPLSNATSEARNASASQPSTTSTPSNLASIRKGDMGDAVQPNQNSDESSHGPMAASRSSEKASARVTTGETRHGPISRPALIPVRSSALSPESLVELWQQEQRAARRRLEPEGSITGATRELQAGLGSFLEICNEHGVKVGPWRLQHVVPELNFGDHPTYGTLSIAHWACKDGQPWKVGIGLFLARSAGKPKDLEIKLQVLQSEPAVIDHLILLRPEDDLFLTGKSKTLWQDAERRGHHSRLEPVALDGFAMLYSFPRWLAAVTEELPEGQPLPNLADLIQEQCESLLTQVCMPIQ